MSDFYPNLDDEINDNDDRFKPKFNEEEIIFENNETNIDNIDEINEEYNNENIQIENKIEEVDDKQENLYAYASKLEEPQLKRFEPQNQDINKDETKEKQKTKEKKKTNVALIVILSFILLFICSIACCAGMFVFGNVSYSITKDGFSISNEDSESSDLKNDTIEDLKEKIEEETSKIVTYNNSDDVKNSNTSNVTLTDVSDVVEEVIPCVVSITNCYTETLMYFQYYQDYEAESCGSGVIIGQNENELLIATNYHVIENANELYVNFSIENLDNVDMENFDSKKTGLKADVKGMDKNHDIAIVSIPKNTIPPETYDNIKIATIGDSDQLKLGEPVIAIGNACGYGTSVTAGIVSALNKSITIENTTYNNLIQTDAAINPGNSGGALFDEYGNLVGINSAKLFSSGIEGMGYAIAINSIDETLTEMSEKQTRIKAANSGVIGIQCTTVTKETANAYNMPQGVYVEESKNDNLFRGDIIVEIDGTKIQDVQNLQDVLKYYEVGEEVEIMVKRPTNDNGYDDVKVLITIIEK